MAQVLCGASLGYAVAGCLGALVEPEARPWLLLWACACPCLLAALFTSKRVHMLLGIVAACLLAAHSPLSSAAAPALFVCVACAFAAAFRVQSRVLAPAVLAEVEAAWAADEGHAPEYTRLAGNVLRAGNMLPRRLAMALLEKRVAFRASAVSDGSIFPGNVCLPAPSTPLTIPSTAFHHLPPPHTTSHRLPPSFHQVHLLSAVYRLPFIASWAELETLLARRLADWASVTRVQLSTVGAQTPHMVHFHTVLLRCTAESMQCVAQVDVVVGVLSGGAFLAPLAASIVGCAGKVQKPPRRRRRQPWP